MPSKIQFLPVNSNGSPDALNIADSIYDSLRGYRRDHCAVFIDPDSADDFLRDSGLMANVLDPEENWHWTGARHHKKMRPVFVGDYEEWFRWFMKWQRFNAFQVIVLITPMRLLRNDDKRGYLDGFLTRLLNRPSVNKVIIVEEEDTQPLVKRWLCLDGPLAEVPELKGRFETETVQRGYRFSPLRYSPFHKRTPHGGCEYPLLEGKSRLGSRGPGHQAPTCLGR